MKFCRDGIATVFIIMLTACAGVDPSPYGKLLSTPTVIGTETTQNLDDITIANHLVGLPGAAQCDVTVSQIVYMTSGVQPGELTNASAAVLVPSGANCPGPFPLIAFARATVTETASQCRLDESSTEMLMTFFAAQGYAVVATDFLGYAESTYPYHPYTHAPTEASSIIDSIRATREAAPALGLKLNNKIMLSGYSQGGQASMATQREIEQALSGEFNVVAAAHLAGPYNISGALVAGAKNPINGVQSIVPFQIASYQKIYGNAYANTSDVFQPAYAGFIADAVSHAAPRSNRNRNAARRHSGPGPGCDVSSDIYSDLGTDPTTPPSSTSRQDTLTGIHRADNAMRRFRRSHGEFRHQRTDCVQRLYQPGIDQRFDPRCRCGDSGEILHHAGSHGLQPGVSRSARTAVLPTGGTTVFRPIPLDEGSG